MSTILDTIGIRVHDAALHLNRYLVILRHERYQDHNIVRHVAMHYGTTVWTPGVDKYRNDANGQFAR